MIFLLATLLSCTWDGPSPLDQGPSTAPTRPVPRELTAIPLARRADEAFDLVLPPSSRPDGAPAPDDFGLAGPLELQGRYDGVQVYRTPLPIHSNLLPDKLKGTHVFGSAAPPGLVVRGPDGTWPFERKGRAAHSYGFDRDWLYLGVGSGQPVPDWEQITLSFARATEHENGLNRATADLTNAEFIGRNLTLDEVSTSGLYLPAPGSASWAATIPERAVFAARATVLPPAVRTPEVSDGAAVVLELVDGDEVVAEQRTELEVERWRDLRWEIGEHAGRELTVRIRTEPGASAVYDHVFLEEPTIYTPSDHPQRTVLVFVDTLRPDHLGMYGYTTHDTTPFLDRWAAHGAVFEQARSVAPWTLPSARAALSGHQPESWYETPNIAEQFADAGYATEAIVANAFLSQPFDMHRGWTRFHYQHLWPASEVARTAREAIARYPDRDLLLLVHFMDPHLPYEEPLSYRYWWARMSPDGHEPSRARLYAERPGDVDAMRAYVGARYDQNIRYVDDEVRGVLEAAGVDATTILFSDHGEEFWEHGSFEHGHSFHDEVLRVPLVVRGPSVPAVRFPGPVSLLDVTPTALELAGLPVPEGPGISLVGALYAENSTIWALDSRPQAFGRPLYEQDGWAVLDGGKKWVDRAGERQLYELETDPGELTDVAPFNDLSHYPEALSHALDREVVKVWRIRPKVRLAKNGFRLVLSHPDGFREAWKSYDPRGRSADTTVEIVDGSVLVVTPPGAEEPPNAIFVVPNGDWALPEGMELVATAVGMQELTGTALPKPIPEGPQRNVLLSVGTRGWSFLVDTAHVPVRAGVEVSGFHQDVEDQLRDLGYVED